MVNVKMSEIKMKVGIEKWRREEGKKWRVTKTQKVE